MEVIKKISRALYPQTCPFCECVLKQSEDICDKCKKEVFLVSEPKCEKCGRPLFSDDNLYCEDCLKKERYFDRGVVLFPYVGNVRESLHRFKYMGKQEYAAYYARIANEAYGMILKKWGIEVIVPVPMYPKKEKSRGYNQAAVFAKELSKVTGIPYNDRLIVRVRDTAPQKEMSDLLRYQNLKNAFGVNVEKVKEFKNILLVDDVFTTGSTVDMSSRVLKKGGAQKVYALCIASGISK